MRVLFVFVAVLAVVGIGLLAGMFRRDESLLGVTGLGVLTLGGVLGTVYGFLVAE